MPTIAQQLNQLEADRQDLVDNLTTMGIEDLTGDETFTELVPEVLNIPSGGDVSDYFGDTITANGSQYGSGSILPLIKKLPSDVSFSGLTGNKGKFLFYNCKSLTTIPQIDTSSVTSMESMFQSCLSITTVPSLNSSNVTTMKQMFSSCNNLVTAPTLDTSNVTDMNSMFMSCGSLTTIPTYNTIKTTNMSYMFMSCTSLETAPQLDTSKVTNFSYMFNSCTKLKNVPVYDFSSATNLNQMFGQISYVEQKLTNDSLNNILASCASATSFTGTKTFC